NARQTGGVLQRSKRTLQTMPLCRSQIPKQEPQIPPISQILRRLLGNDRKDFFEDFLENSFASLINRAPPSPRLRRTGRARDGRPRPSGNGLENIQTPRRGRPPALRLARPQFGKQLLGLNRPRHLAVDMGVSESW